MSLGCPHYLHVFSTFAVGGPQIRAVRLMAMSGDRVRHTVIAMDGRTGCLDAVPEGVRVEVVGPPSGGLFSRLRHMRRILRAQCADLLLTYNWGAIEWLLAARLVGESAVVHHEDGFGPEEAVRFLRRRIHARRLTFPSIGAVIVPSRTLLAVAEEHWRVPNGRLHYLPNGVDCERFVPGSRDQDLPVIGLVGGVRPEKNQALAVEALAAMKRPARLRIVGDGPDLEATRDLAARLGVADRVEFLGALSDTAPSYHGFDVFMISSRTEQMPIALLEAMASGLPVVGTDVGDVRSMLAEVNRRFVVPVGDASALASALDEMVADVELRSELGRANRERCVAEFAAETCYGAYLERYERLRLGHE